MDPPPKKILHVRDEKLARAVEAQRERIRAENAYKRTVFKAICALAEPIDSEHELLQHLSFLDPPAWCEVVEERFLGRLCGYPLCANDITVDFRKKFIVLRRGPNRERKMIVPIDSEPAKFCSDRCMAMARAIAAQLDRVVMPAPKPTGDESADMKTQKQFIIPHTEADWKPFLPEEMNYEGHRADQAEPEVSSSNNRKFGVELVKRLHDLKLADEEEDDDEAKRRSALNDGEEGSDSEREEQEFLHQIKAFVTKRDGPSAASLSSKTICNNDSVHNKDFGREWKRGFLVPSSSSSNKNLADAATKSESTVSDRNGFAAHGVASRVAVSGDKNAMVGKVIERLTPKESERGKTATLMRKNADVKALGKTKKPPTIVQAPRISAEQVRLTF